MITISDTDALAEFCARARSHPYVTVDTEFLRERTYYSKLCLIQMAIPGDAEADAVLVDPLSDGLSLDPLYALFEERYRVHMVRAEEKLRAVAASAEAASLLGLQGGAPLLSVDRVAFTYGDRPVELRRGLYHTEADHYRNQLN